ncbi:hypothetical protein BDY21DRAFT_272888, partial [Lineolata rhizophorae]
LRLPLELRREIYSYILPRTLPTRTASFRGHAWARGHTSLLGVNRQLSGEGLDLLYGANYFVLDVAYDGIRFRYRWVLPRQRLAPNRAYAFPAHFSPANVARMRNFIINVTLVDDYIGMTKYNCGGRGLIAGLRAQVQRL